MIVLDSLDLFCTNKFYWSVKYFIFLSCWSIHFVNHIIIHHYEAYVLHYVPVCINSNLCCARPNDRTYKILVKGWSHSKKKKVWCELLWIMWSSGFNRVHHIYKTCLYFEEYPMSNVETLLSKLRYDSNTVTICKN